jgi:hypothetical protein
MIPEIDPPRDAEPLIRAFRIPPSEIVWMTSLFEAYDGIALVRTLDRGRGIIECWIMPSFLNEFERLLASAAHKFPIQPMEQGFA